MNVQTFCENYLNRVAQVLKEINLGDLEAALTALQDAWEERQTVFICGNGGSAATASHLVNDLTKTVTKKCRDTRLGFRCMSLGDNISTLTAIGNDVDYDDIFSIPLDIWAKPDDILIVASGSGNSRNVLKALEVARAHDLTTIGLLGKNGGKALHLVDHAIVVPSHDYGPIEDAHMVICHLMTEYLSQWIFDKVSPNPVLNPNVSTVYHVS